jgi:actin-like ATPase involved in cell morphogenesis
MGHSYFLAVDVGTSRVGAATARLGQDGAIVAASFPLGRRSDSVATVVFVAEDGELLFGDAAERRGVTQPDRLIREFKRSIGDEVPLMVGGHAIRAEQVYARTVVDVIETVAEREGARPEGVILTHPAIWGPHRIGMVRSALAGLGVADVGFMTEPEAAARHYEAYRALGDGDTLAVYDLGGGTFDCVILRKADGSFEPLGEPVGLENLGGADFDDAVMRHVLRSAEVPAEVLLDASADTRIALSQLRRECVDAKEALSFDSDVAIPVLVGGGRSSVRLTRAEFEGMIDGSVARTIDALQDALDSAGVDTAELESVLLIGGSSRIPLVTQRLSERLDRPTAIDADPKSSIALGAARTALVRATDEQLGVSGALAVFDELGPAAFVGELDVIAPAPAAPAPPVNAAGAPPRSGFAHIAALSGGAIVVAAAIVFGSTLTAGSGSGRDFLTPGAGDATPTPTAEAPAPAPPDAAAPPATEQQSPRSGSDSRSGATKGATRAPAKKPATAAPSTRPSKAPQPVAAAETPKTGTGTTQTPVGGDTTTGTDPDTDPGTTDPGTTDPGTTDPGTTDPGTTDPGTTDPGTTDPGTTDPGTTDPGTTDPGTTDPGTTDPGTTDPGTTDPGTTDPGTTDPGTTDPGTTDPGTTDPGAGDAPPPTDPAPVPPASDIPA